MARFAQLNTKGKAQRYFPLVLIVGTVAIFVLFLSSSKVAGGNIPKSSLEVQAPELGIANQEELRKLSPLQEHGLRGDGTIASGGGMKVRMNLLKSSTTRDGLERRQSTIPGASWGLFTTRSIGRGDFVGFYCGDQYTKEEKLRMVIPKERETYQYDVLGTSVVPDPRNERHKMCLANEPPQGLRPNMEVSYFFLQAPRKPDRPGSHRVAAAIQMHANREVEAGEELFWYYGTGYERLRMEQGYKEEIHTQILAKADRQDPGEVVTTMPLDCFVSVKNERHGGINLVPVW